jgi:hypothetical protein
MEGLSRTPSPHASPMNVIDLNLDNRNFHCPVTGARIYGDGFLHPSPATRGIWIHEVPDEPVGLADELEKPWTDYGEAVEAEDEWYDPDDFLKGLERENWVAFCITTTGFACGPVWETVWIAIDMNHRAGSQTDPQVIALR